VIVEAQNASTDPRMTADRSFRITLYARADQPVPIDEQDFTWPELVDGLRDLVSRMTDADPKAAPKVQKAALMAWAPHRLSKSYRLAANVEAITCLAIDVDQCAIEPVIESIEALGITALIYESPSDPNPDGSRRVRIVSPITRDIVGLDECDGSRLRFAQLLGLVPGNGVEGALGLERLFYAGQLHDTEPRSLITFDGAPVDVDALMAEPLDVAWSDAGKANRPKATTVGGIIPASLHATDEIGAVIGPEEQWKGSRWHICGALGGELRKLGLSRARGEALISAWLATNDSPKPGVDWFVKAWDKSSDSVSGRQALAALIGDDLAEAVALRFAPSFGKAIEPAPSESVEASGAGGFGGYPVFGFDTDRKGDPRPTINNAHIILESVFQGKIRFDEHRRRIVVADVDPRIVRLPAGPWTDVHTIEVCAFFESFGLRMDLTKVQAAVDRFADRNRFNPVLDYAEQCALNWDGVPRVDAAMATYWKSRDPHASLVSRIFFLSLAKRMIEPGAEVHTVLVLTSDDQGKGKSRSLQALVPVKDWWADSPIDIGNKDGFQNLLGKSIYEIGEAASSNKRDSETLKQYFSSPQDTYRGSFKRFAEDVARTCVFVITANNLHGILRDATGERRYMPISITEDIDVEAIRRDRDQLIGEAVMRVGLHEERYWLTNDEASSLAPAHDSISEHDALEEVIRAWIDGRAPVAMIAWTDLAAFDGPLRRPPEEIDQREQRRVRTIMRRLGWRVADVFNEKTGARTKGFVR
jgi:hypothetical protein